MHVIDDDSTIHVTAVICISADGGHLPPLIVLPLPFFPVDLEEYLPDCCWMDDNDDMWRIEKEDLPSRCGCPPERK